MYWWAQCQLDLLGFTCDGSSASSCSVQRFSGNHNDSVPEWNMEGDSFPGCRSNPADSCQAWLRYLTVVEVIIDEDFCQPVSQLSVLCVYVWCWLYEIAAIWGKECSVSLMKTCLWCISLGYAWCFWKTSHWLSARWTVLIPRLQRSPLKTSTVLSAINITVLNLWMSDEGIEADPDESVNEWWWVDWKSPTVKGDIRSRGCRPFF